MIENLTIKNFKSIKTLQLPCKRVNIFIGDPNAGKSNILEALSVMNFSGRLATQEFNVKLADHVRFDTIQQLFYDFDTALKIEINADSVKINAKLDDTEFSINSWIGLNSPFLIKLKLNGQFISSSTNEAVVKPPKVRFYRFKPDVQLRESLVNFLEAPFGENLGAVILNHKDLRTQIQAILDGFGYKMLFRPYDYHFEIYRERADYTISFPLSVISDTVRRMIFYLSAIESNSENTIVFEEPESNTFPLYIKYLAEKIARYSRNQYFITTHNPYFLQTIIEKTPTKDLSINLVEIKKFQTKVTTLKDRNVEKILGLNSDVFLNFETLKQ